MKDKKQDKIVMLDVRPVIQAGNDPFNEIMTAVAKLNDDETLQIINIFEPIPLINNMKDKGYESRTERPEQGVVHTFFKKKTDSADKQELAEIEESDDTTFQEMLTRFGGKKRAIDVRHLEMPEPMVTILKEVETLPAGHALFVEHKKMPQFLLPELKNRNFTVLFNEAGANNLQLLIFKAK